MRRQPSPTSGIGWSVPSTTRVTSLAVGAQRANRTPSSANSLPNRIVWARRIRPPVSAGKRNRSSFWLAGVSCVSQGAQPTLVPPRRSYVGFERRQPPGVTDLLQRTLFVVQRTKGPPHAGGGPFTGAAIGREAERSGFDGRATAL
ncbi:protein of unknown function [Methylorubrum extorquens]|uniref:Uncharacterized protein n=1 Tax=Methylorubrum extorquens TaxID=408 RepID=A0A2N9AR97_METEX|nr:protein of unknown function [Methylorubrum extorquens]